MSRIGKKPILIPQGVTVEISGENVNIKGPKGNLSLGIHPDIKVEEENGVLKVLVGRETRRSQALWGLFRSLLANMVEGVERGFDKKLEFEGIGFKVNVDGGDLLMQLGFSHPVRFKAPEGIKFSVEKNTITVSGINKELVGNTAA